MANARNSTESVNGTTVPASSDAQSEKKSDEEWLANFEFSDEIFTLTNLNSLKIKLEIYLKENGLKPPTGIKWVDYGISWTPLSKLGTLWAPLSKIALSTNQPYAVSALIVVNDAIDNIVKGQQKSFAILNMLGDLQELYNNNTKGRVSSYIEAAFEKFFFTKVSITPKEFSKRKKLLFNQLGLEIVEKKEDSIESLSKLSP